MSLAARAYTHRGSLYLPLVFVMFASSASGTVRLLRRDGMKYLTRVVLVFVAACALATAASAQGVTTGSLSGRVVDAQQQPVVGCRHHRDPRALGHDLRRQDAPGWSLLDHRHARRRAVLDHRHLRRDRERVRALHAGRRDHQPRIGDGPRAEGAVDQRQRDGDRDRLLRHGVQLRAHRRVDDGDSARRSRCCRHCRTASTRWCA